jgi:hypothetical protein
MTSLLNSTDGLEINIDMDTSQDLTHQAFPTCPWASLKRQISVFYKVWASRFDINRQRIRTPHHQAYWAERHKIPEQRIDCISWIALRNSLGIGSNDG